MNDGLNSWSPFEYACVINLNTREDRWALMQAQFARMGVTGVQRYVAVRPAAEVIEQPELKPLRDFLLRKDGDSEHLASKLCATWGCMHSHLSVIRLAKERGWPQVLILEDDCEFEPYTLPVLRRVARQLEGREWDMLYLGGTFKKGGARIRLSANLELASRIRLGHAYLVNARLYDRILAEAESSGMPIDWYYSEVLQPQIACMRVTPTLAYQRLLDMSDIELVERKPRLKTRTALRRLWYQLRYRLFTFRGK